jgi:hypothetical protein
MDRCEFAVRQYAEMAPKRPVPWTEHTLRQLRHWLKDDVCAAVQDFLLRPAFQEQAAWSLRSLTPGADTPARSRVEAVDASLVASAKKLLRLGASRRRQALATANQPKRYVSREVVECSSRGAQVLEREYAEYDELDFQRSQVESVSKHFWDDLVSPLDYFGPYRAFRFRDRDEPQWGNFIPSLNRTLHPVGDFVVRCMWERIDTLTKMLAAFRFNLLGAATTAARAKGKLRSEDRSAWEELVSKSAALRESCTSAATAQVRDSCVILTQVYVAFDPVPKVEWLGLPPWIVEGGGRLKGVCSSWSGPELFDRVAVSLNDLAGLYQVQTGRKPAIDEAVATGGLVIEKATFTAYWKAEVITPQKPWRSQHRLWNILCKLAERARAGRAISAADVYERVVGDSTLSTAVGRLRENLPPDLEMRIVKGPKAATYQLGLPRNEVFIF